MKSKTLRNNVKKIITFLKITYRKIKPRDYCINGDKALQMQQELLRSDGRFRLNQTSRDKRIIVSLTSFPARFESLHYVIRSMLVQTMPPDEIILYLDDDVVVDSLPESLVNLKKYGLQIEWRPGRIKPHKKYYYAIKEHLDDIIITVDDDIMYPANLIECLYKTHQQFPNCVIATRAHRIKFDKEKKIVDYNHWHWADSQKNKPSLALLATGVGGVLYPPHCMYKDLLSQELLLKFSPRADDIWLKIMQVKMGTKVVLCGGDVSHKRADIPGTQNQALGQRNVGENQNDAYMKNLMEYYQLSARDFGC